LHLRLIRVALLGSAVLFSVPAPGQSAVPHSAPLNLRHAVPLVHVFVNHRGPYIFVLDTGTHGQAIVSPKLVTQLHLPRAGTRQLTDLGGRQSRDVDVVTLESLQVAGVEFTGVSAMVSQLPGTARLYDGVLGFDLFHARLLTIDFPRRLLLLNDGELSAGNDPNLIPYRNTDRIPMVALTINGRPAEAGIDTGGTGLIVPASVAQNLSFAGPPELSAKAQTLVDNLDLQGGTISGNLRLANFTFDRPFVEIASWLPIVVLGADTFRDFVLTFDQRTQRVQLASAHETHRLKRPPAEDQLIAPPADVLARTVMRTP
jgi:predicted aspartyl protease